jgi:hypothetical protein
MLHANDTSWLEVRERNAGSAEMLSDEILIFGNGKWTDGGPSPRNTAGFADVKRYHANLIGYVRLAICIVAAFLVYRVPWVAAALLLGATLLDWIDGPIARHANRCSILGSGVDGDRTCHRHRTL